MPGDNNDFVRQDFSYDHFTKKVRELIKQRDADMQDLLNNQNSPGVPGLGRDE